MNKRLNYPSLLVIIVFTIYARGVPLYAEQNFGKIVLELVPDPNCGECTVPTVDGLQPLLFTASPGISAEESFFPFLPQEILTYVGLSSDTLQSPLEQLLKDNFAAIEVGQFDQARSGFETIEKSLSCRSHSLEVELSRLGLALAEFDSKKSAERRLKKLAEQKTYPALARLAAYVLARSLENRSRAEQAKDWYNQVIKTGEPNDLLVQAASKRKRSI